MKWIICCLIWLIVSLPVTATLASQKVELKPGKSEYSLGMLASYFEDEVGDVTVSQLLARGESAAWQTVGKEVPNFAFSDSVYWIRLDFESHFTQHTAWWFELAFPLQDYIDFYVVEGSTVLSHVKTGDKLPFNSRPYDYRNFLFDFSVPAGSKRQVYIRLDTIDGLHEPMPMLLWDKDTFAFENGLRNLGLGIYFGILFVIVFYNLFIYLSVRDKAYIYYVLYIGGFSFWLFSYYGFSYQHLWPDSPTWANQALVIVTSCWGIFMVQFVRAYLNTALYVPWFERLGQFIVVVLLVNILIGLSGYYGLGILMIVLVGTPGCVAGIFAGYISWRADYRPAAHFLLAWTALLLAIVFFCLKITGLIPSIWLIERSLQIGSVVEVVLLSLGLADRINILKREKIQAQEDVLKSFESNLKLKNDFIMAITHELRTPMNAILGGLQVSESKQIQDPNSPLSLVQSGATDMMKVVNDILIHTEIQSGQLHVQADNVGLKSFCDELVKNQQAKCEAKGLEFSWRIDDELPGHLVVDRDKLKIILNKLLGNARKFTDSGQVGLSFAKGDGSTLVIQVSDSGAGISAADQIKIFDPFVQKEGGLTRRYNGIGIGLSICERLAQALEGTLTISSKKGEGSTFTLTLPLVVGETEAKSDRHEKRPADFPILVVEDNLVNQKVIVKMLEKLGYSALVANQGEEALNILSQHDVSLILMDLQMPVMDGFTCTEAIRARNDEKYELPVIAVSANLTDADKQHCIASGINDFMEKPVKLGLLENRLLMYLEAKPECENNNNIVG